MSAAPQCVSIGDVATIERGIVEAGQIKSGSLYVGLENIEAGGRLINVHPVDNGELASSKFAFTPHHVLFGKLRPYLAKIARPDFEGICSTDILPVLPGPTLDRRYFAWFLLTPEVVSLAASRATGANLPRLSPKALARLQIPLPPLPEQRRIADILDKADALRIKRRTAIQKLDELTQSVFLDMFGDPQVNSKRFPVKVLPEFYVNSADGTKCGPFGSALKKHEFVQDGVPVWNMDNIDDRGRMMLPCRMCITPHKFRQLASYAVRDGDVIISRAGTVGKMCVVSAGLPESIISTNLIRVRFGTGLLPLYFVSLMTYCKGRVGRLKTGPDGAFTHMSTRILDTLKFPYPPPALQKRFVETAQSIEAQTCAFGSQAAELDELFASLQHRAFHGEL